MWKKILFNPWTKRALFIVCLAPVALLAWWGFHGNLTADPVAYIEHYTGDWTLRFLLITLGVTPLRNIFQQPLLIRYRRMLGLFAFFYGCVHLSMYLTFDQSFDIKSIWADVLKRRYITVGALGWSMMVPLAITSNAAMVRRLGPARWQRLHRLAYLSALAGGIHYYWLVKSDVNKPFMYLTIWAMLMIYRLPMWIRQTQKPKPQPASVTVSQ